MNQLETQSGYIQAAINDYNKAKITVEKLKDSKEGSDILIPIGGSSYVNANVKKPKNILFDIGEGFVIEKSSEDTIENIDKRIKFLEKNQEKLNEVMQNLQKEATEISMKAQEIYKQQQG